jgi:hypothetical protein
MSLKAGGVALNLTAASHVMLMDPWWNPAVEQQAQDRIHRLGQVRQGAGGCSCQVGCTGLSWVWQQTQVCLSCSQWTVWGDGKGRTLF